MTINIFFLPFMLRKYFKYLFHYIYFFNCRLLKNNRKDNKKNKYIDI